MDYEGKIRKLLALANDKGATDHERAAALAKAKELRKTHEREALGGRPKRVGGSALSPDWAGLGRDMKKYQERMARGSRPKRRTVSVEEHLQNWEPDLGISDTFDKFQRKPRGRFGDE